jgi:hypothetical protein
MRSAVSAGAERSILMPLAIWLLLVLALARPGIELESGGSYTNIAGRVIAIDLGAGGDIHRQRRAIFRLLEADPQIPTAMPSYWPRATRSTPCR